MLCDLGIDDIAPVRLERCESTLLVNAHQPTVAGDIGRKDRRQPPFDPRLGHERWFQTTGFRTEFMVGTGSVYWGNDVRFGPSGHS